jgi:hypothetical protein
MRPSDIDRPRSRVPFDAVREGARHGCSPELSLAIWKQVCADAAHSRDEQQRFHELAARVAAGRGVLPPDIGKTTLVGESAKPPRRAHLQSPVPGRDTLVAADDRESKPRPGFDDHRVLGLRALLRGLGANHPLRHELLAASAAADRSIAGRATLWQEPLPTTATASGQALWGAATASGQALWGAAERHAAMLYRRAAGNGEVEPDDSAVEAALQRRGTGQLLPAQLHQEMEHELGVSLAGVRIHVDEVATRAAAALQAEAFTVGEDIFFAEGTFAPESRAGRRLLAHELTHVAQALRGRTGPDSGGFHVSHPDEPLEQEADAVAARVDAAPRADRGDHRGDAVDAGSQDQSDSPRRASAPTAPIAAEPSRSTATLAAPRILRQASSPPWPLGPLPASPDALHGIELYYMVETVPRTEGTDIRSLIQTDEYTVAPQMHGMNSATPSVAYYVAFRKPSGPIEYVIGPDSLLEFLNRHADLARIGAMAYAWGQPAPYQRQSALMMRSIMLGRFGDASRQLGRAWLEALKDPGWWIQVIVSTAGAVAGAPGAGVEPAPPALTVIEGGGGTAVARTVTPLVVGNNALAAAPEAVAAAPPQLRLIINPEPQVLAPAVATRPIPAIVGAAAASLGTAASRITAPVAVSATAQDPDSQSRRAPDVILYLPSAKVPRISLYEGMVGERRLVNEASYRRGNPAQIRRWDAALMPGGEEGMSQATFNRGVGMGLTMERILRPNWSSFAQSVVMEVDHIVELQVIRATDRGWADTISNYELLDSASNGASGAQLYANIQRERQRLAAQTGDPSWLTRDLIFTKVIPTPGDPGQRWTHEAIQQGDHITALQRLLGEH